jgi:hypothetical protein
LFDGSIGDIGSGTTFFAKNLVIAGLSSMILVGVKLKEKAFGTQLCRELFKPLYTK